MVWRMLCSLTIIAVCSRLESGKSFFARWNRGFIGSCSSVQSKSSCLRIITISTSSHRHHQKQTKEICRNGIIEVEMMLCCWLFVGGRSGDGDNDVDLSTVENGSRMMMRCETENGGVSESIKKRNNNSTNDVSSYSIQKQTITLQRDDIFFLLLLCSSLTTLFIHGRYSTAVSTTRLQLHEYFKSSPCHFSR